MFVGPGSEKLGMPLDAMFISYPYSYLYRGQYIHKCRLYAGFKIIINRGKKKRKAKRKQLAEKELGVVMDTKLNMSNVPLQG